MKKFEEPMVDVVVFATENIMESSTGDEYVGFDSPCTPDL